MTLISDIISTLPFGKISEVIIGLHWTAVVTEVEDKRCSGLASTISGVHNHHSDPEVSNAGHLDTANLFELAEFAESDKPLMRSVGIAAINSVLPSSSRKLVEQNAADVIVAHGYKKKVVVVGRFPFIPSLQSRIKDLVVLEITPDRGELPANSAQDIIPAADVVAITGMSLINCTFENLINLCSQKAYVMLLGPSVPLSPIFFDYGVDILCGSVVADIEPVIKALSQGANFRQLHRAGVRLVSLTRD